MDLGPLEPCPYSKSGKHNTHIVIPSDDDRDLTLLCGNCMTMRRVPASGSLRQGSPLDDWPASEIKTIAKGSTDAER